MLEKDLIWKFLIEPFTAVLGYNKLPIDYLQAYYGFVIAALLLAVIRICGSSLFPLVVTKGIILIAIVWGGIHAFLVILYFSQYPAQRSGASLILYLSSPSFIILAILMAIFLFKYNLFKG